jgi:hypothetical protein
VLKRETHLPVIVDPSHAAGAATSCCRCARAAVAAAPTGSSSRSHPRPEEALCDGPQQIPAAEFGAFADEMRALVALMGKRSVGCLAVVGTGLMGAPVGLAAKRAGSSGRRLRLRTAAAASRLERGRVDERRARRACSPAADLASSRRRSRAARAGRGTCSRAPATLHGHRRRLDEGLVGAARRGGSSAATRSAAARRAAPATRPPSSSTARPGS